MVFDRFSSIRGADDRQSQALAQRLAAARIVQMSLDLLRNINNSYGHLAGDYILKTIAIILKNHTNPVDTVARYGGEEFVIVLPDHD